MTYIRKANLNAFADFHFLIVAAGNKGLNGLLSIFHCVSRLNLRNVLGTLSLTIAPLSFLHLNMRTVTKHNVTQISSRICSINLASKALGI